MAQAGVPRLPPIGVLFVSFLNLTSTRLIQITVSLVQVLPLCVFAHVHMCRDRCHTYVYMYIHVCVHMCMCVCVYGLRTTLGAVSLAPTLSFSVRQALTGLELTKEPRLSEWPSEIGLFLSHQHGDYRRSQDTWQDNRFIP